MRKTVAAILVLSVVLILGAVPALADAGLVGGSFIDVPKSHPAYSAVQDLLARGVLVPTSGGQFMGDQPLLRYDAAVWLSRSIKNLEAKLSTEVDLSPRVSSLETQVRNLSSQVSQLSAEMSTLSNRVSSMQQTLGQTGDVAQKAQLGVILGFTGVALSLASLIWLMFF